MIQPEVVLLAPAYRPDGEDGLAISCCACGKGTDMIAVTAHALTALFRSGHDRFANQPVNVRCQCRGPDCLAVQFRRPA